MLPRSIVLGYHLCRRTLARQVVVGKKSLTPSANEYDWLGHGIYFVEGEELYPGGAVSALDHVQICVRNPARILGYFLPRDF